MEQPWPVPPRRRRRAVGPAGAQPERAPAVDLAVPAPGEPVEDDVERWQRERPPHHDRGV